MKNVIRLIERIASPLMVGSLFWVGSLCLTCSASPAAPAENLSLQGHRGARGRYPEYTLAGFRYARSSGMDTLECDVQATRDGAMVLYHDDTINSGTGLKTEGLPQEGKRISQLTLAEFQSLEYSSRPHPDFPEQQPLPGAHPLTLEELLDAFREDEEVRYSIELKFPGEDSPPKADIRRAAQLTLETITSRGLAGRTIIQSFEPEALAWVRDLHPDISLSALYSTSVGGGILLSFGFSHDSGEIIREAADLGAQIISPNKVYCTSRFIRRARSRGLKVIPWTVNKPKTMEKLVRRGVDGIITDYPARLAQISGEARR